MSDIVAFLPARLDEEQAETEGARNELNGEWTLKERSDGSHKVIDSLGYSIVEDPDVDSAPWWTLPHIARHDPARVLADVAAKRRILARHYPVPASDVDWTSCGYCRGVTWPCLDLRDAAAPFADCSGYEDSWRPDAPD